LTLTQDELGEYFVNDKLREEIADAYAIQGTFFCKKDYFGLTESEALSYGWERFCTVLKHKTRFVFLAERDENVSIRTPDDITPADFLDHLAELITELGLVRELSAGTRFCRVRVHDPSISVETASDLGPPPVEHARFANRMSPAGIPLFYGATDRRTAVCETYEPEKGKDVRITSGEFVTARPILVCDFTDLPTIPSLFDPEKQDTRQQLMFLHDFVADLSKPIEKDGREHIEYVPTEVVTEYLRRVFAHPELGPLHGILYRSARRDKGVCCALFFDENDCTDIFPGWERVTNNDRHVWWLGLDALSVVTRKPPKGT